MTKKLTNHLIAFFVVMTLAGGPADAGEADGFQALLYAGRLAEAAALSERQIQGEGDQFQAHFNLGVTRFLQSVERLSQSLYRHGLRSSLDVFFLPFFRLPVPDNPNPEPLNYEAARKIVDDFITDLADVEKTLAEVGSDHVRLPLDFGRIRLDIDGDDTATEEESLWRVFQRVAGPAPNTNPETIVDFDGSDAVWLRGYSHLLMAIGEFLLAHDWQESFERTFHALFPRSGLPYTELSDRSAHTPTLVSAGEIADFVAFVHLIHWPVVEPDRLAKTRKHLKSVVSLSRENWRAILAETDDQNEWIPNPSQSGAMTEFPVTAEHVEGWQLFLDEFDALLDGQKLIPHWRLTEGINLRRVFEEPSTFDLILWIQGSASFPYLEAGEVTSSKTWARIINLFRGDFFRYAVLFN